MLAQQCNPIRERGERESERERERALLGSMDLPCYSHTQHTIVCKEALPLD